MVLGVQDIDHVSDWLFNIARAAVAANVLPRRGDTVAFEQQMVARGKVYTPAQMAIGTILFGIIESVEIVKDHGRMKYDG